MASPDSSFFLIIEELPSIPLQKESMDERSNGFGMCLACKKFKQVWARICGLCGEACE
ncbi:hypothetical protein LCGC14_2281980 [marine sediment metagenome]|uniref:Uncharacterized protein n=1 Tax=marine sediment metagenome TaxID=412755 RepID=A0A0F9F6E1_9ZZZZ